MTAMRWRRWVKHSVSYFFVLKFKDFVLSESFFFQLKIALYTSYRLEVIMIVHINCFLGK